MTPLADELRGAVGSSHVLVGDVAAGFEQDWTGRFGGPAQAVVRPADRTEIESVLSICRQAQVPVIPQGGNTGLVGGSVPRPTPSGGDGPVVLSTARLTAIGALDQTTGQITVEAGVTLAALQAVVRNSGWRFAVDLGARDRATIGGMIATNAGGLHVVAHGMMRRQVLGLEAVLPTGRLLHHLAGLTKDNTGYDLGGLLCGSEGTLAVITAARLRLIPEPSERVVALLGLASVDDAVALSGRLRRCDGIEAIEVFGPTEAELAATHGDLDHPFRPWPPVLVLAEVTGSDPATSLSDAVVGDDTVTDVAVATTPAARRNLWAIRELITDALLPLGPGLKLDVTVPIASVGAFVGALEDAIAAHDPTARTWVFGHLGDGNLHVNLTGHRTDPESERSLTETILTLVADLDGSISAEHGIGVAKRDWLHLSRTADERAVMQAIKDAWDPDHLMNPGVLFS